MDIRPILLLTALITFVLAEEPPSGNVFSDDTTTYQGTREKRNFAQLDPAELLKRAPMGFQGMRGKKNSLAGYGNEIFLEDTNKRAPMGFQGMRGKKNKAITNFEDLYSMDDYEKRAPMGFQGMRGKKLSLADEYYKRAPMGFQGMRGKKSFEQILDETRKRTARFQEPEKDVYLFDYPDYGKRTLPIDRYEDILDRKDEWEIGKGPLVFQGTKGKEMILDTLGEVDKRGVIDFRGMQGKRDTFDNYVDYSNPFDHEKIVANFQDAEGGSESLKRAQMGFHGMRGKRNAAGIYGSSSSTSRTTMDYPGISSLEGNSLAAFEIEKRSPIRYLGFRGKKNPRWEFRGKFIGVRGKKSSNSQTIGHRQAVFY